MSLRQPKTPSLRLGGRKRRGNGSTSIQEIGCGKHPADIKGLSPSNAYASDYITS